jgi:hypothetical protein
MIDAMLGRKEDAIREGARAVELLPVERDTINGSQLLMHLAMIAPLLARRILPLKTCARS